MECRILCTKLLCIKRAIEFHLHSMIPNYYDSLSENKNVSQGSNKFVYVSKVQKLSNS